MFSVLTKAEVTSLKMPVMGTWQHQGLTIPYNTFLFSFASHNLPCHLKQLTIALIREDDLSVYLSIHLSSYHPVLCKVGNLFMVVKYLLL